MTSVKASRYAPFYVIKIDGKKAFEHGRNSAVLSVEVNDLCQGSDEFQFKIRDRNKTEGHFPQASLRWLEDETLQPGSRVEIEMGYADADDGGRDAAILGEITRSEANFPDSGGVEITVSGHSLFHRLHKKTRTQKFINMNYKQIVAAIAKDHGLSTDVTIDTVSFDYVQQGESSSGESDADFLSRLAEEYGCEVFVTQKQLLFRPIGNDRSPVTKLHWGRDLVSFKPTINVNGLRTRVAVRGQPTDNGGDPADEIEFTATKPPTKAHEMGKELGTEYLKRMLEGEDADDQVESFEVRSREEAEKIAKLRFNRNALEFLTGQVTSVGDIRIRGGEVVELDGLGRLFNGKYYVTRATHRIDSSGYQTRFEVKRSGLGS